MKAPYISMLLKFFLSVRSICFDAKFTPWILCLAWIGYGGAPTALAGEDSLKLGEFKPEQIFHNHCSVCHGDHGDGRSRASTSLVPPPRNFTIATDLTREKMIATVTNGKPGTAMVSWKTQLSEKQIEEVVDYVRSNFMQEAIAQHLTYGGLVYGHNCASCHGNKGQGVVAAGMTSAPHSFAIPQAKTRLSRERMIVSVTDGLPGTAMTGYAGKLSAEFIGSVVDYVRDVLMTSEATPPPDQESPLAPVKGGQLSGMVDMGLPMPKGLVGDTRLGEKFFLENCFTCHGKLGDGQGPRAYFMASKPRNFLDDTSQATLNRPVIFSAITSGRPGTEMPAWGKVLSEQEIANVAEFVFQTFIQPSPHIQTEIK